MKQFDLPVVNNIRKSFYGKAKVTELDNGDIELTKLKNGHLQEKPLRKRKKLRTEH